MAIVAATHVELDDAAPIFAFFELPKSPQLRHPDTVLALEYLPNERHICAGVCAAGVAAFR